MSLGGLVLGLINVAITVAILLLVGAIVKFFICQWLLGKDVPPQVEKLYIAVVALIALYMIVALLLGLPTWRIVQHQSPPIGGMMPPTPSIIANAK